MDTPPLTQPGDPANKRLASARMAVDSGSARVVKPIPKNLVAGPSERDPIETPGTISPLKNNEQGSCCDRPLPMPVAARQVAMLLEKARQQAAQAERRYIERELHDTLSQSLTGIILQLETAEDLAAEKVAAAMHIHRALQAARNAFREMRRTLDHLCPEALERENLPKALARVSKELTDGINLHVQMSVAGAHRRLPLEIETALLRIGQEALTNTVRHACARHAWVTLRFGYRNVRLRVTDDGKGFRVGLRSKGFGLTSMEERTKLLGGRWTLQTEPAGGTQISVSIPVRACHSVPKPSV